jgi:hypothetical protein
VALVSAYMRFKAHADGSKVCFYVVWSTGHHEMLTQQEYLTKRSHNATPPYKELIVVPLSAADTFDYQSYCAQRGF